MNKEVNWFKNDNNEYICKICGKISSKYGIKNHIKYHFGFENPMSGKHREGCNKGLNKNNNENIKKASEIRAEKYKNGTLMPGFKGKHHSEESKEKIRLKRVNFLKAKLENNPFKKFENNQMSFGEKWLHNIFLENKLYEIYDVVSEYSVYPYFIDFAFINEKIAVEFDGGFHFNSDGSRVEKDIIRDKYLNSLGWRVYRIIYTEYKSFKIENLLNFLGNPKIKTFSPNLISMYEIKQNKKMEKEKIKKEKDELKKKNKIVKEQNKKIIKLELMKNDKRRQTFFKIKHQQGEKNSQFGKCWIYNLKEKRSLKIKKEELDSYLKLGWIKGRKFKF